MDHICSAEKDQRKRAFIVDQFKLDMVVGDIMELSTPRAWNTVTSRPQIVRWGKLFGAGFSCRMVSNQNSQRGNNKKCVQDQEGVG